MTIEDDVHRVEERADAVQKLLPFATRAFVIEFAGTPKSGKSTSVEAVRHFFSRHGFRVHVLIEPASVCPIPMKGHLFFNTWCTATMLAELIANVDTETDLIILDRGLFDSLVWLTLQRQRGELTQSEAQTIESFLLLDRWRQLIDLAVVMNVSADEAVARENSQRISNRSGSIMNPEVLSTLTRSVKDAVKKYGPQFGGVIESETTGQTVKQSNVLLAEQILDRFERFLDPEILVAPKKELARLPLSNGGAFSREAREKMLECIETFGHFMRRSQAEMDLDNVQIISCGLLTHKDQVRAVAAGVRKIDISLNDIPAGNQ